MSSTTRREVEREKKELFVCSADDDDGGDDVGDKTNEMPRCQGGFTSLTYALLQVITERTEERERSAGGGERNM